MVALNLGSFPPDEVGITFATSPFDPPSDALFVPRYWHPRNESLYVAYIPDNLTPLNGSSDHLTLIAEVLQNSTDFSPPFDDSVISFWA
jgi:hypothetical protein